MSWWWHTQWLCFSCWTRIRKEDWRTVVPESGAPRPKRRCHSGAIAIVSLPQCSDVDVYDFVMVSEPKCGPTSLEKQDKGIDWHSRCVLLWLRCLWWWRFAQPSVGWLCYLVRGLFVLWAQEWLELETETLQMEAQGDCVQETSRI